VYDLVARFFEPFLRGEDSPLVRPYLLAHERRSAPRRVLLIAGPGTNPRPLLPRRAWAGI
jgi:hypothetical protein